MLFLILTRQKGVTVKLATTALLASLALAGCATDNEGAGGGYLTGMRPAKPSIDDVDRQNGRPELNNAIVDRFNGELGVSFGFTVEDNSSLSNVSTEVINVPFPIQDLCEACDVVVLRDPFNPHELKVLDDAGRFFCSLWINDQGFLEMTNCN